MITFAVAAGKEDFVLDITATFGIQKANVVSKLLPLSVVLVALIVSWISAIQEAEVEQ